MNARYRTVGCLLLSALAYSSCRSAGAGRANAPFDPLSLDEGGPVLKKYLDRLAIPAKRLALIMDARIEASLPNMKKSGVMTVERRISATGHVQYDVKKFEGDNTIKKEVIARVLSAEQESTETSGIGINPQNYRFKHKRTSMLADRSADVFEISPRRAAVGLFKGELWLDQETGLPLRETGRLSRNPSVVFKTIDFTRDYELRDGRAFDKSLVTESNTRIVGKVLMSVTYSKQRVDSSPATETKSSVSASRH